MELQCIEKGKKAKFTSKEEKKIAEFDYLTRLTKTQEKMDKQLGIDRDKALFGKQWTKSDEKDYQELLRLERLERLWGNKEIIFKKFKKKIKQNHPTVFNEYEKYVKLKINMIRQRKKKNLTKRNPGRDTKHTPITERQELIF